MKYFNIDRFVQNQKLTAIILHNVLRSTVKIVVNPTTDVQIIHNVH